MEERMIRVVESHVHPTVLERLIMDESMIIMERSIMGKGLVPVPVAMEGIVVVKDYVG